MSIVKKVFVLLVSMLLISCSSMHKINFSNDNESLKHELRIGSVVTVTMVGGQTFYKKKVTGIGDRDFLVSGASVPYEKVEHIEISKPSSNKTLGLVILLFVLQQLSGSSD